jgi:hypothetical protein
MVYHNQLMLEKLVQEMIQFHLNGEITEEEKKTYAI